MYKFVSIEQLAAAMMKAPLNTTFDFTFDTHIDIDLDNDDEPTGWFGLQMIDVFGSKMLIFGFYGGDVYSVIINGCDSMENIKKVVVNQIYKWFNDVGYFCPKYNEVCLEVTDKNLSYI